MSEQKTSNTSQDPGLDAFMENQRLITSIIHAMKEVPELPSEVIKPQESHPLQRVEFPEEGGVLTYMDGYSQPYRGFPSFEFVDKIDLIKKIIKGIQSGVYHALKRKNKLTLLLSIFLIPITRSLIWAFAYSFHRLIERFRLKTLRYSKAVRELHRACSLERLDESKYIQELRMMIKDFECMVLEFDNAYRFRMQDVAEEINKENLRKNPIKELLRIWDILIEREFLQEQKDKWYLLKKFTSYYLRFDRKMLRMIVDILLNLNIEEFKLTVEDKFYSVRRKDYIFGFMKNPKTAEDKAMIREANLEKEFNIKKDLLLLESDERHKELNKKQEEEKIIFIASVSQEEKDIINTKIKNEEDKLKKEYNIQLAKLNQEIAKLNEDFNNEQKKIMINHLSKEHQELLEKHQKETADLDKRYASELKELDENITQLKLRVEINK